MEEVKKEQGKGNVFNAVLKMNEEDFKKKNQEREEYEQLILKEFESKIDEVFTHYSCRFYFEQFFFITFSKIVCVFQSWLSLGFISEWLLITGSTFEEGLHVRTIIEMFESLFEGAFGTIIRVISSPIVG